MSLQYIIDGYNITNNLIFRQCANNKVKDSRDRLIEFIKIRKSCGSPKNKIMVVFDGYPESPQETKGSDMDIVFSRREKADEVIKRVVEQAANPKTTVVVSDDKEIKLFVRYIGAKAMGVQEFIKEKEGHAGFKEKELLKPELSFSAIEKINQELRRIWLK